MSTLVVDASALIEYLLRTPQARFFDSASTLPDADLHVPGLCDLEDSVGSQEGPLRAGPGDGSEGRESPPVLPGSTPDPAWTSEASSIDAFSFGTCCRPMTPPTWPWPKDWRPTSSRPTSGWPGRLKAWAFPAIRLDMTWSSVHPLRY